MPDEEDERGDLGRLAAAREVKGENSTAARREEATPSRDREGNQCSTRERDNIAAGRRAGPARLEAQVRKLEKNWKEN